MHKHNMTSLLFEPLEFVNRMSILTARKYIIYKALYIILNILTMLCTFTSVLIFAVILWKGGFTVWFLITNVSLSAGISLVSSLLNLFVIKKNMILYHDNSWRINAEITHYYTKTDDYKVVDNYSREYKLFLNISIIVGITSAIKGDVQHG